MKRIIAIISCIAALAVTVLIASSCGESAPEKTLTGYFEALHDLDADGIGRYTEDGETGTVDFSVLKDRAELAKKILYVSFTVIDDGIDDASAVDIDETTVRTSISYIDYSTLFGRINGEIAVSGGEKARLLSDALEKGNYSMKKAEIDIVLVKRGGKWKIPVNAQKNSQLMNSLNVTYIIKWISE